MHQLVQIKPCISLAIQHTSYETESKFFAGFFDLRRCSHSQELFHSKHSARRRHFSALLEWGPRTVPHSLQSGRPSLALDMMEEFRPVLVDALVLELINKGRIKNTNFVTSAEGCTFTKIGKRIFLRAWEQKLQHKVIHPAVSCTISMRQVLEVQIRKLMHYLLGQEQRYWGYQIR